MNNCRGYVLQCPLSSITAPVNVSITSGSSVDALAIIKHYAGYLVLSGMPLQAADVNGDAAINTADALLVAKRFVNMITSFPASDWIIETPAVSATNPILYNVNLKAICRGDVNGSYVP